MPLTKSARFVTEADQEHGSCWGDWLGEEQADVRIPPQTAAARSRRTGPMLRCGLLMTTFMSTHLLSHF